MFDREARKMLSYCRQLFSDPAKKNMPRRIFYLANIIKPSMKNVVLC